MKKNLLGLTTFSILTTCNVSTAQVNANFGWTVDTMFCGNMMVSFSDSSTGFVTSWFWDFGNAGTSTLQNPTAIYSSGGIYSVTLIVVDGGGNKDTLVQDSIINVPFANGTFTFTPDSGSNPLTVCFYANTINTASYIWDFGDGTVLNSLGDTCHTYTSVGTFNPVLILQYTLPTGAPCLQIATNLTGQVTVDSTAGVDESQRGNLKLKAYPNPTTGIININSLENAEEVFITDIVGQKIIAMNNNEKRIGISTLSSGVYLLNVRTENGIFIKKIIKK